MVIANLKRWLVYLSQTCDIYTFIASRDPTWGVTRTKRNLEKAFSIITLLKIETERQNRLALAD